MVDRTVPSLTLRGLSAPVVVGNRVYVGLDNGRVLALRTSDGQVAWEQVVSAPTGRNELERITDIDAPLLSDGGELFAASFGGEIACLDDETGQILWRSEEHTSELQSLMRISYAVFCWKKKNNDDGAIIIYYTTGTDYDVQTERTIRS